jgi:CYTH domain-containing protein
MKKLEIEDKFLLKKLPKLSGNWGLQYIQQYYLEGGARIREIVDIENNKTSYVLTRKKKLKSGVYEENEKNISKKVFLEMLFSSKTVTCISKFRRHKKIGKVKWDIDMYDTMQLVTAEVEMPSEGFKYQIPKEVKKEIIMNVTELQKLTNRSLSEKISRKLLIKRYV